MKLNRNFVQIGSTAVITAVAVYFIMKTPHADSEPISWKDAQAFMMQYDTANIMKTKYTKRDGEDTISVLKGFVFNAIQLDSIINNNQSSIKPDNVLFLFGKDGAILDTENTEWPIMRFIAVGLQGNQILTGAPTNEDPSIYDKADPCPPNCPFK